MNRNEMIIAINNLFDENTELKFQIKRQTEYYDNLYENSNKNEIYGMTEMQKKIYDIGLKHLFQKGFDPNYSMKSYSSDKYYSFEEWLDISIKLDGFNDIAKNEFIKLFSETMKTEYERRLEKEKKKDQEGQK